MEPERPYRARTAPEIRPMMREDIPQVARLYAELLTEQREETEDPYLCYDGFPQLEVELSLEEDLRNPEARVFVAEAEGEVVAMIVGHVVENFLPYSTLRRVGQITAAYVRPSHRGLRLMTKLEQLLIDFFREESLPFVELYVFFANVIGHNTWRALGYTTFREQMRKRL